MRLKNWSVISDCDLTFAAPELQLFHLQGNVYGHPRFDDGTQVFTSRIVNIEDAEGYKIVRTRSGSEYHLYKEDVDPNAETLFPNYYERLSVNREDRVGI